MNFFFECIFQGIGGFIIVFFPIGTLWVAAMATAQNYLDMSKDSKIWAILTAWAIVVIGGAAVGNWISQVRNAPQPIFVGGLVFVFGFSVLLAISHQRKEAAKAKRLWELEYPPPTD